MLRGEKAVTGASVDIPVSLARVLERDVALQAPVLLTLRTFQPWIRTSLLPFFPAYTDHSDKHITDVLTTASSLITDEARALLTAADVAVLTLSSLLHDVAMHLTPDGFRALVKGTYAPTLVAEFGDRPWPELWSDFLGDAVRFDGRQLTRIFGKPDPIDPRAIDLDNLSEREHLLIGEFLRRHHARLAHQIALSGVPGPGPEKLQLNTALEYSVCDLSGLIARSHNLDLRSTYDYLSRHYDRKEFKGVRAVFLMVVLRLADYLQVQSERAEKELLYVRQLRSPVSQREWKAHHAIRDIRSTHDDPDALFIDALPTDIETFSKLAWLLKDIQRELDQSWAVLGEVYGRTHPLNRLGLTIRRIRSSLDDLSAFSKRVSYIPVRAAFEAGGPDLLKLLVGPLYGNAPGVAVRELIQNSVDASRELTDWQNKQGQAVSRNASQVDVEVIFDETAGKHGVMTIRDRGIGMTVEVILNYFLKAGASYRFSDAWRKRHIDEQGRSRVLRGGRFGVGALAAFLIGDTLQVTTRHFTEPDSKAIAFSASLEASELDLHYTTADIGTTITIPIRDRDTWHKLIPPWTLGANDESRSWYLRALDWFCISTPTVSVSIKLNSRRPFQLKPRFRVPEPFAKLPDGWFRVPSSDYADVQWTYKKGTPALVCNGIFITDQLPKEEGYSRGPGILWGRRFGTPLQITRPNLSIHDNQGILPLDLQRTRLIGDELSFDDQLSRDVARDLLAHLCAKLPHVISSESDLKTLERSLSHSCIVYERFLKFPALMTRQGIVWLERGNLNSAKIERIWAVTSFQEASALLPLLPNGVGLLITPVWNVSPSDRFRLAFDPAVYGGQMLGCLGIGFVRGLISDGDFEFVRRPRTVRRDLVAAVSVEHRIGKYAIAAIAKQWSNVEAEDFIRAASVVLGMKGNWLAEWVLADAREEEVAPSPISSIWAVVTANGLLPFAAAEREVLVSRSKELLEPHLSYHFKKPLDADADAEETENPVD